MVSDSNSQSSKKIFYILVGIGILVNATGLFLPIIEPDSALYASITKHIALTNDWVNLFGDGHDWLDKPHFPFWMAAISFKIFGINAFAYKLPSFIFWLAGIYFTYLVAKLLFNKTIAQWAVITYITALHVVIANFDVRAEPYLTTCIIAAIFFICKAVQNKNIINILLAALFAAFATMTKGIFVLVTIFGGHIIYWIINKDWKQFINYKLWLLLLLTFVFILPELYCLYIQFDLHPEKIIFGKTNVSGLKFFFWDSQFGRFFNTGPIKGEGDKFFFLHTTLWAFMPWAVIFYIAIIKLIRGKMAVQKQHWIIYGGAVITFLLFSLSSFQLPHYIIIIFPQFAILSAAYLYHIFGQEKILKRIYLLQTGLIILMCFLILALVFICNFSNTIICMFSIIIATIFSLLIFNKILIENILIKGIAFTTILGLFLNFYFYPNLFQYQSGMQAGSWLNKNNVLKDDVVMYKFASYSLEFYANKTIYRSDNTDSLRQLVSTKPVIIYTDAKNLKVLKQNKFTVVELQNFSYYPITKLSWDFLNSKTRDASLSKIVLVKVAN